MNDINQSDQINYFIGVLKKYELMFKCIKLFIYSNLTDVIICKGKNTSRLKTDRFILYYLKLWKMSIRF